MTTLRRIGTLAVEATTRPWFNYALLAFITLLAAALRFYKLGAWSFWIDEIYTINHATAHFSTPQLILDHLPPHRNWVPLSVILTAQLLNVSGVNEFNARLVAAVFGILTVPALYFPVKKMFNSRVALIAVLLLAVSPWHIDWSQNARGYTALFFFYSLAFFAFYFGIEEDRPSYLVAFFVLLYLSTSERMLALFLLPVLAVYLLAVQLLPIEKPKGLRARTVYILLSPLLLLGLIELAHWIINGSSILGAIYNEVMTTFVGKPIENPVTQATFMLFKLGIPLTALSFFSALYLLAQKDRRGLLVSLGALIPVGLVVVLTPFMFIEERYAFASLPCWLILAALAIDWLLARTQKMEALLVVGILAVLLGDAMGSNLMYYHTNHGNRRNWREAFALVQQNMQEGDVVVSTWPELGNYYLPGDDVLLWQEVDTDEVLDSDQRIWFVVIPDMAWYTGTEDFYWWVAHNTRMVKTIYIRTVDNANLEIYLFDPDIETELDSLK